MINAFLLLASLSVVSPNGRLAVDVECDTNGVNWSVERDGKMLVLPSSLGLRLGGQSAFGEMKVVSQDCRVCDETWQTKFYRREKVRNHYNELTIGLEEVEARELQKVFGQAKRVRIPRKLNLVFRAYDEGIAFRYQVPEQKCFTGFDITEELTEWRFADKPEGWFTSYDSEHTSQEGLFERHALSTFPCERVIGFPVVLKTGGVKVAIAEAALSNWAGLFLTRGKQDAARAVLRARLAKMPHAEGAGMAVIAQTPAASPWRVMMIAENDLQLLSAADMIVNLNPPPDPTIDFSWVKPGVTSWDWWVGSNNSLSTEQTLGFIDFAAEAGWAYHTVDAGWSGFERRPNHGPNVPLEPRKGFDLKRIVEHANKRGVGLFLWIHWREIQDIGIEETFARMEEWGVKGVKTDFLERQDQWMINWCEKVCRAAAKHHILINFHGSFRPSGTERTWPNNLTREAIRGNETLKWSLAFTAEHKVTLPFTRFLLGPGDFTPGGFDNVFSRDYKSQIDEGHRYADETDLRPIYPQEPGTRAAALALCVAFDSPLMTLCDWPERYRGAAGFEALKGLPAVWRETRPIVGVCGERYAVVREAFDGRYYFAALTVKPCGMSLPLDFLGEGNWEARIFADDPVKTPKDAKALRMETLAVNKSGKLAFKLCEEGGAVVIFNRKTESSKDNKEQKK